MNYLIQMDNILKEMKKVIKNKYKDKLKCYYNTNLYQNVHFKI